MILGIKLDLEKSMIHVSSVPQHHSREDSILIACLKAVIIVRGKERGGVGCDEDEDDRP
jgi:hypothetical protein